jgi:hypothetical protein
MRTVTICCALLGFLLPRDTATAQDADAMLSHDVYFTLQHDSDEAKEKLLAGCKKYLAPHPGVVWFAAGVLVKDHQREVNDRDFDVALHMVFKDKESHDKYQDTDNHHKFIEEFQENWKAVRVFDSFVNVSSHVGLKNIHHSHETKGAHEPAHEHEHAHEKAHHEQKEHQPDQAKKPRLPDSASSFAGMVRGKVVAKYDSAEFSLDVAHVIDEWQHSKAENPKSLIGRTVLVNGRKEHGENVAKFIRSLKVGEMITIDVAHQGKGEALTILELTPKQRQRIK